MDRWRAAGALLALAACIASSAAAPTASNHTALDLYDGAPEGCYYNFQRYGEGDRIMTNEPCLNCTCHNRMLMCYLRVCPFTKPIGQDCTVEKRADQCCPIVTCPDVPVDLLTSTSTNSPAEYGATGLGRLDKYGCSIHGKYFPEGSKVPPTPNKPCEHCYCIRNMTTCVMQECTLHVDGCTPIYHKDVCCPVRYSCDHPEDEIPLLDDMTTTVRPTPGFLLTTTTVSPVTQMTQDCVHDDQVFPDGALIKTEKACEHCYCMKGDIVCVVQECGTPMENEGKNCTSLAPREGQCCPDTYICEGDDLPTGTPFDITTEQVLEELTPTSPPRRVAEGSGYRNEPDDSSHVGGSSPEPEIEGSGDDQPVTDIKTEENQTPVISSEPFVTTEIEPISSSTKTSLIEEIEEGTPAIDLSAEHDTTNAGIMKEDITKAYEYGSSTTVTPILEEVEKSTAEPIEMHGTISEQESSELDQLIPVATTASVMVEPEKDTTEVYDRHDISVTTPEVKAEEKFTTEQLSSTAIAPAADNDEGQHYKPDDINETETLEPDQLTSFTTIRPIIDIAESEPTTQTEQDVDSKKDILKLDTPSTHVPILEDSDVYTTETSEDQDISNFMTEKESIEPEEHIPISTSGPQLEDGTQSNIIPDAAIDKDISDFDEFIPISTNSPATSRPLKELYTSTTTENLLEESDKTTMELNGKDESTLTTIMDKDNSDSETYVPRTTINPVVAGEEPITLPEQEQNVISETQTTPVPEIEKTTVRYPSADSIIKESSTETPSDDTEPTSIIDEKDFTEEDSVSVELERSTPFIPKDDQISVTTDATFRKEDNNEPADNLNKEAELIASPVTSAAPPAVTETQSPMTALTDESVTLQHQEPTESSFITQTTPSHKDSEPTFTTINKLETPETTTINIGDNEIDEEFVKPPGRIPGEGDCLLDGITYRNESVVPSTNKCHTSCKCLSSIIKCDPIICSPPPEYMNNCQSIYDSPDSCCPTYVCDHSRETVPPESQSQMSGTEKPVPSTSIECRGDQCEIIKEESLPPINDQIAAAKPCQGDDCDVASLPEVIPESSVKPCEGDNCYSISDITPAPEVIQVPIASCEGDNCSVKSEKPLIPEVIKESVIPCVGDSCDATPDKINVPEVSEGSGIPCEGDGCVITSDQEHISEIPKETVKPCEGGSCDTTSDKVEVPDVPGQTVKPCEGDSCVITSDKGHIPETPKDVVKPCEGDSCDATSDKDHVPEVPEKSVKPCQGDSCGATSDMAHIPEVPEVPVKPCEGDSCDATSDKDHVPEVPEKSVKPCQGDSCGATSDMAHIPEVPGVSVKPCEGDSCDVTSDKDHVPEVPEKSVKPCQGDSCGATSDMAHIPEVPGVSVKPCEGDSCDVTADKVHSPEVPVESVKPCEGISCDTTSEKVHISEVPKESVKPCEGDSCGAISEKPHIPEALDESVKPCEGESCDATSNEVHIPEAPAESVKPCDGEGCDITSDKTHMPEVPEETVKPCEGDSCGDTSDKAHIPKITEESMKPCEGDSCDTTSDKVHISEVPKESVKPCDGDSCGATSDKDQIPEAPEDSVKPCEGESCDATSDKTHIPEVPVESVKPCDGDSCDDTSHKIHIPEIPEDSVKPCEGEGCDATSDKADKGSEAENPEATSDKATVPEVPQATLDSETEIPEATSVKAPENEIPEATSDKAPKTDVPEATTHEVTEADVPEATLDKSPDTEIPEHTSDKAPETEIPEATSDKAPNTDVPAATTDKSTVPGDAETTSDKAPETEIIEATTNMAPKSDVSEGTSGEASVSEVPEPTLDKSPETEIPKPSSDKATEPDVTESTSDKPSETETPEATSEKVSVTEIPEATSDKALSTEIPEATSDKALSTEIPEATSDKVPETEIPEVTSDKAPNTDVPEATTHEATVADVPEATLDKAPDTEIPEHTSDKAPETEIPEATSDKAPETEIPEATSDKAPETEIPEATSDKATVTEVPEATSDKAPDTEIPEGTSEKTPETEVTEAISDEGPQTEIPEVTSDKAPEADIPEATSDKAPKTEVPEATSDKVHVSEASGESVKPCEGQDCTITDQFSKPVMPQSTTNVADTCNEDNDCQKPQGMEPSCIGNLCQSQATSVSAQGSQTETSEINDFGDSTTSVPIDEQTEKSIEEKETYTTTITTGILNLSEISTDLLATTKDDAFESTTKSAKPESSTEINITEEPHEMPSHTAVDDDQTVSPVSQDITEAPLDAEVKPQGTVTTNNQDYTTLQDYSTTVGILNENVQTEKSIEQTEISTSSHKTTEASEEIPSNVEQITESSDSEIPTETDTSTAGEKHEAYTERVPEIDNNYQPDQLVTKPPNENPEPETMVTEDSATESNKRIPELKEPNLTESGVTSPTTVRSEEDRIEQSTTESQEPSHSISEKEQEMYNTESQDKNTQGEEKPEGPKNDITENNSESLVTEPVSEFPAMVDEKTDTSEPEHLGVTNIQDTVTSQKPDYVTDNQEVEDHEPKITESPNLKTTEYDLLTTAAPVTESDIKINQKEPTFIENDVQATDSPITSLTESSKDEILDDTLRQQTTKPEESSSERSEEPMLEQSVPVTTEKSHINTDLTTEAILITKPLETTTVLTNIPTLDDSSTATLQEYETEKTVLLENEPPEHYRPDDTHDASTSPTPSQEESETKKPHTSKHEVTTESSIPSDEIKIVLPETPNDQKEVTETPEQGITSSLEPVTKISESLNTQQPERDTTPSNIDNEIDFTKSPEVMDDLRTETPLSLVTQNQDTIVPAKGTEDDLSKMQTSTEGGVTNSHKEKETVGQSDISAEENIEKVDTSTKYVDSDVKYTTEGAGYESETDTSPITEKIPEMVFDSPSLTESDQPIIQSLETIKYDTTTKPSKKHIPDDEHESAVSVEQSNSEITPKPLATDMEKPDQEHEQTVPDLLETTEIITEKGIEELEKNTESSVEDTTENRETEPTKTEDGDIILQGIPANIPVNVAKVTEIPSELTESGTTLLPEQELTSVKYETTESTPYLIELQEHTHINNEESTTIIDSPEDVTTKLPEHEQTIPELSSNKLTTSQPEETYLHEDEIKLPVDVESSSEEYQPTTTGPEVAYDKSTQSTVSVSEDLSEQQPTTVEQQKTTLSFVTSTESSPIQDSEIAEPIDQDQEKPAKPVASFESTTTIKSSPESDEKSTTIATSIDKYTKPEDKITGSSTAAPEIQKPEPNEIQPTEEISSPDDSGHFAPSGTNAYGQEPDYFEDDQTFGPGTCRYGGKVYVSAQQIPRDDPCDFCFCFRSDIICLQQSCPPPIHGCHEEPIQGFCCPRYECPVSMATTLNVTTTTTTTTTTLPPNFPTHSYKGAAQRRGCQIKGHTYKVGEVVRASSGPCLHCTCGGDGQMKCDPKACTPEPMLRQMIAAAVSAKRRR